MKNQWSIKQIAAKTKLSENTLRFYEKEGLIQPERGSNGYRYYSEDNFQTLKYIVVMKYAHFSLQEIKVFLLTIKKPLSKSCNQTSHNLIEKKLAELKEMIRLYQKIADLIEGLPNNQPFEVLSQNYDKHIAENNQFIEHLFTSIYKKGDLQDDCN